MKKGTYMLVIVLAILFSFMWAVGLYVVDYNETDDSLVMESDVDSVYVDTDKTYKPVPVDKVDEDVLNDNTTNITVIDEEDEVILEAENVNGAITTDGTDITVTTFDGNTIEVDIDQDGGSVVIRHDALDDEMLEHGDRGLCIAGLGGNESPIRLENKNGDAYFEISTSGEGEDFNGASDQLESCGFDGLVKPSDLRSDRP